MDWFYALNDEQQGPVTETQLEHLVHAGTVTPDTLVWNKDLTEWKPLSIVRAAAAATGTLPPIIANTRCAECGHIYVQTDMIKLHNYWVCATCKPKFLQRMMEGGTVVPSMGGMMWRKRYEVVLGKDVSFPDRCVCCNEPANGFKLKRDLSWHPPAYYILAISPIIYVIVAMIVRKKATIYIGLCEMHRSARKRTILIASLAAILGLLLFILAAVVESGWLVLAGLILLFGGGIFGAVKGPIVSSTRIDNNLIIFKGAGQPFLNTLPEWTGPK